MTVLSQDARPLLQVSLPFKRLQFVCCVSSSGRTQMAHGHRHVQEVANCVMCSCHVPCLQQKLTALPRTLPPRRRSDLALAEACHGDVESFCKDKPEGEVRSKPTSRHITGAGLSLEDWASL